MESTVVYSNDGSLAMVDKVMKKVLRLNLASSDGIDDFYPQNVRDASRGGATRKPGEKFEEWVRSESGDRPDLMYRTKLADFLAEQLGFKGEDAWVLDTLPAGYCIFTLQKVEVDSYGIEQVTRRDTYVYGHPTGSRFRSPNEMGPHLLSLVYRTQDGLRCSISSYGFQSGSYHDNYEEDGASWDLNV
ncbi:hypothetical protein ABW19_dt0205707 [Dactylella cylindrospora]|nr:hypothetical protein ABW19_dt0205707 [Dactylella cylindrospora]